MILALIQSFRMALRSISGNKVRSGLTMLGIIIGVSAVITLVSIVQGTTRQITDQLQSMGTNLITLSIMGRSSTRNVSEKDIFDFVDKNSDIIECVAPMVTGNVTVKAGNKNLSTSLEGTNEAYRTVRNTDVQQGRFLNAFDVQRKQKVVLAGTYIVKELFPDSDPVGQVIKINGDIYTIIGVLETKSNNTAHSGDDKIIVPYTIAMRLLRNAYVRNYSIQGKTPRTVEKAMTELQDFLYKKFGNTNAYRVFNQADMLERINETTATLAMMLGGIAGISLLVGGIGIMNIMLVTVTERTKEIGIRKAVGAKRRNILAQFLIEAVVVSCLGGIIGIMFGMGLTKIIGKFMNLPAYVSIMTIMLSFSFSVVVGVFFGLYPANRASKLNPIEALRME